LRAETRVNAWSGLPSVGVMKPWASQWRNEKNGAPEGTMLMVVPMGGIALGEDAQNVSCADAFAKPPGDSGATSSVALSLRRVT
jgi:hypothetical protein